MASLATIDFQDIDTYASKKAAKYGMKGKFTGIDSKGEAIESSGSGKNEGKYTLKDVRKCIKVQEWIEQNDIEGEKEVKKVNDFSSKSAKEAFDAIGISLDEYRNNGGKSTGKRTKGSITKQDVLDYKKSSGTQEVVSDDKKYTTKKMMERIEKLGNTLKAAAKEYLKENKGSYKSGKFWGKKEVDAAIEHAMQNI
jgi:hypothetical protein